MISLHNLKPHYGSMHKRKRLGTGQGSGHGQTSTRGQKGQHSTSGGTKPVGFEGGQTPLLRRIPKDPMTNSTEWGLRSYQDSPDSLSWGGQNVFDVYTQSQDIALDETRYSEW